MQWAKQHPKTTAFILGLLSVSALPPYYILPALFVGISGILYEQSQLSQNKLKSFALGYWFGFGFYGLGFFWIAHALLFDAKTLGWLIPFVFIGSGGFFGLFSGIVLLGSSFFKTPLSKILSFAAIWTIMEWIRSFILTGFPWNLLGTVWGFSDTMIQTAALYGTYGLSLITLIISGAPLLWLKAPSYKTLKQSLILIIIPLIGLILYGEYRLSQAENISGLEKIRIVQPSIPQDLKWNDEKLEQNFQTYLALSQSPGIKDISLIIWGETASPYPLSYMEDKRRAIAAILPPQTQLMTGSIDYALKDGRLRPKNSMFTIDHKGHIVAEYTKSHLVPFGEYIPFRNILPKQIKPVTNVISDFIPGGGPQTKQILNGLKVGISICYEIIFPHQILDKKHKPEVVINLTNDGWYGNTSGPYQHFISTKMRAVEEGVTLIRAANSGISAVFNAYGQMQGKLALNQKGILDIALPKQKSISTPYGQIGNLIPIVLCLLIIGLSFALEGHKLK